MRRTALALVAAALAEIAAATVTIAALALAIAATELVIATTLIVAVTTLALEALAALALVIPVVAGLRAIGGRGRRIRRRAGTRGAEILVTARTAMLLALGLALTATFSGLCALGGRALGAAAVAIMAAMMRTALVGAATGPPDFDELRLGRRLRGSGSGLGGSFSGRSVSACGLGGHFGNSFSRRLCSRFHGRRRLGCGFSNRRLGSGFFGSGGRLRGNFRRGL